MSARTHIYRNMIHHYLPFVVFLELPRGEFHAADQLVDHIDDLGVVEGLKQQEEFIIKQMGKINKKIKK